MKSRMKISILLFLSITYFNKSIFCFESQNRGRYFLGSLLGSFGGALLSGSIYKFTSNGQEEGFIATRASLTLIGSGIAFGSCIGTTIISKNKLDVLKINLTVASIPIALMLLGDKTAGVGFLLGVIVVPIFSGVNAYRIDKQDYYSANSHIHQNRLALSSELTDWSRYSPLGKTINVYQISIVELSW